MVSDKQPRSSFVGKLHQLLSSEQHPEALHWLNNDTFAITSNDAIARSALLPAWEFRSLSSFIRQLSYYSFKRLSDRRRSAERRSNVAAYIVFTHPSANFVRDDPAKTTLIPRKLRARKPTGKKRKDSTASSAGLGESADGSPSPGDGESFDMYPTGEEASSEVQLGLQSYQLAPWNANVEGRTVRSPTRNVANPPLGHLQHLPNHLENGVVGYASSGYPSPSSAGATQGFFPTNVYYPPPQQQHPQDSAAYYYTSTSTGASQGSGDPFPSYQHNSLPPLRALTSGLVAPLSPPPEAYHSQLHNNNHYSSPQHTTRPLPSDEEAEQTPSPVHHHAHIHSPQPQVARPSVAQLDHRLYYGNTTSSPRQSQPAYFAPSNASHLSYQPHQTLQQHVSPKSAFYHLAGNDHIDYSLPPLSLQASHA